MGESCRLNWRHLKRSEQCSVYQKRYQYIRDYDEEWSMVVLRTCWLSMSYIRDGMCYRKPWASSRSIRIARVVLGRPFPTWIIWFKLDYAGKFLCIHGMYDSNRVVLAICAGETFAYMDCMIQKQGCAGKARFRYCCMVDLDYAGKDVWLHIV